VPVLQVWTTRGARIGTPVTPYILLGDDRVAVVARSIFPVERMPADPTGTWSCATYTVGGQLVGLRQFQVVKTDR
jgi:hypothetical protein